MPINNRTHRRNPLTGTSKTAAPTRIEDLFGFVGLHELGAVFEPKLGPGEASVRRRGRKAAYPPICMLAVLTSARATGSLASALALLHTEPGLWERCVQAFEPRFGMRLPAVPPTRDQVVYFRDQLAGDPALMNALQMRFRHLAVGQARRQGNLNSGVQPDGANPLEAHAIYGDGTVIAKYSDVRETIDPATGEIVLLGSRAKSSLRARVQRVSSDTTEDGKAGTCPDGLNMVAMHTWTANGRITLGTGVALGGEAWAAMDLIESLHSLAGDGIHSLIYDRAITGWHVDSLMANQRIQVIGKAVGASSQQAAWERTTDQDLKDAVQRRMTEYGVEYSGDTAHLVRHDVLADILRYHERMPLGLCIYPTSNRNFDLVRSWARELEPVIHEGTDGQCVHRIAIDDGGLFEVAEHPEDDDQVIKVRVLGCANNTPYQRADGRWGTRSTYPISCPHGDTEFLHVWEPVGIRHAASSGSRHRAALDPVGWRLRPLSRADDLAAWYNAPTGAVDHFDDRDGRRPFSDIYSRRNDSESYNEWFQQSLQHHGRAMSLQQAAQELDFLLAALLNNSITWANRR